MSNGRADNNLVTPLRTQEISSLCCFNRSFSLVSTLTVHYVPIHDDVSLVFSAFFLFSFEWHNFHNALSGITTDRCAIIDHYHKQFRAVCTWLNWNYQGRNACRAKWRALKNTHRAGFDIPKYVIIFRVNFPTATRRGKDIVSSWLIKIITNSFDCDMRAGRATMVCAHVLHAQSVAVDKLFSIKLATTQIFIELISHFHISKVRLFFINFASNR